MYNCLASIGGLPKALHRDRLPSSSCYLPFAARQYDALLVRLLLSHRLHLLYDRRRVNLLYEHT